jgi:hypothetical protein
MYTDYNTYEEIVATKAAIAVGQQQVAPTCAVHDKSCTFLIPANPNIKACENPGAQCPPAWIFVGFDYFAANNTLAYGTGAIKIIYPGSSPTTTTTSPAPSLSVNLSAPSSSDGVAVGSRVAVVAKITAVGGSVNSINLGQGLSSSNTSATVVTGSSIPNNFSLGSGASRSVVFEVKATKAGTANLALQASGKTSSGSAVSGSGTLKFKIGVSALTLTVATSPKTLTLKVANDGSIVPDTVAVKVTATNTSKATISGVQLLSLNPQPADPTQALNVLGLATGTLPVSFKGSFAPGASASKSFKLQVTGDGTYTFRALALYDDPTEPGGNGRSVATGGNFTAKVPLLYFSGTVDPGSVSGGGGNTGNSGNTGDSGDTGDSGVSGAPVVKGGSSWLVDATIKDESSYQNLCVSPLIPKLSGNAAATGPSDITVSTGGIDGPFAGALAPGKTVHLQMFVATSVDGTTHSTVSFAPVASLLDAGGSCDSKSVGSLTKLASSGITVPKGTGSVTVHVDESVPLAASTGTLINAVNFFGGFGQNLFGDTFHQVLDVVALARSASSTSDEFKLLNAVTPGLQLGTAAKETQQAAQAVYAATGVYADYWRTASDADKQSIIAQTASVLSRVGGDFWSSAKGTVTDAAEPYMQKLQTAYATGDDAQVWHLWGQGWGSLTQQAVMLVFFDVLGNKISGSATTLEKTASEAEEDWTKSEASLPFDTALETVKPGTVLDEDEAASLWGVSASEYTGMSEIAVDEGVNIGVRSRSPGSIAELEKGSVWKNENIKPKNVDDIDIDWLGFRPQDIDQVRFRTFTDQQVAAITEKIQDSTLTKAQKSAVFDRLETRLGEEKYVSTIQGYSKQGEINVGFNYRSNGLNVTSTRKILKFDLLSSPIGAEDGIPAGGTYYTPYQENLNYYNVRKGSGALPANCKRLIGSVLCTITGDVDGVYITNLSGGAVAQTTLLRVYKKLQALGWQHPETLTWINNQGQFFFGTKADILSGLEQGGGQAMMEFGADGVQRATYLNLKQSSLIGSENYRVQITGGYSELLNAAAATH